MKRQRFNHHPDNCTCPGCTSEQPESSGDALAGRKANGGAPDDGTTITNSSGGFVQKFKPFLSEKEIVEQLQTQWGTSEDGTIIYEGEKYAWGSSTIRYWIPTPGSATPDDYGFGESASFNADMMVGKDMIVTSAFEEWDSLIAHNLSRVYDPALDANMISFAYSSTTEDGWTYNRYLRFGSSGPGYGYDYEIEQTAIWLADDWRSLTEAPLGYGSFGYFTYLHEIGHALGLSHPGTYRSGPGVTVTYGEHAEHAQDTTQYSIMSYFGAWFDDDHDGTWTFGLTGEGARYYPSTPMLHDVMAIQAKYGDDNWTRWTDTVYGFGSTAGNAVFDFDANRMPILTIWDASGYNTLDCSRFDHDQTINLEPGSYSSIGRLVDNVAIAYGTEIHKAIGGLRNDTIYGNSADNWLEGGPGRDYLDGKAGGDTMIGGGGNDTYVVDDWHDTITEEPGGGVDTVISFLPSYELRALFENATVGRTTGGRIIGTNGWGNVLTGNEGGDTLDGRTGADTMRGLGGSDTYYVDNLGDRVEEMAGQGTGDTVYVAVTGYVLPESVEHGIVSTTSGLTLTGNGSMNHLHGNAGFDTLDGGAGADRLTGGAGKDIFVLHFREARGDVITDFEGFGPGSGDAIRLFGYGTGAYLTQSGTTCSVRSPDGIVLETFTVSGVGGFGGTLHDADYHFF